MVGKFRVGSGRKVNSTSQVIKLQLATTGLAEPRRDQLSAGGRTSKVESLFVYHVTTVWGYDATTRGN